MPTLANRAKALRQARRKRRTNACLTGSEHRARPTTSHSARFSGGRLRMYSGNRSIFTRVWVPSVEIVALAAAMHRPVVGGFRLERQNLAYRCRRETRDRIRDGRTASRPRARLDSMSRQNATGARACVPAVADCRWPASDRRGRRHLARMRRLRVRTHCKLIRSQRSRPVRKRALKAARPAYFAWAPSSSSIRSS